MVRCGAVRCAAFQVVHVVGEAARQLYAYEMEWLSLLSPDPDPSSPGPSIAVAAFFPFARHLPPVRRALEMCAGVWIPA